MSDVKDTPPPTGPIYLVPPVDEASEPDSPPIQEEDRKDDTVEMVLPALTSTPFEEVPAQETLIRYPLEGEDWAFTLPTSETQNRIQEDLTYLGLYNGKQNGLWGNLSVFGIQEVVGEKGVPGQPSYILCFAVSAYSGVETDTPTILSQEIWEGFANELEKDH